jgi:hypothetical protein
MATGILRSAPDLDQSPTAPPDFEWSPPADDTDRQWWAAQHEDFEAPAYPGEPTLPLAEFVAMQAALYRDYDSDAADLIAQTLDALAAEIRFMGQGRPIGVRDYRERKLIWEGWQLERVGAEGGGR